MAMAYGACPSSMVDVVKGFDQNLPIVVDKKDMNNPAKPWPKGMIYYVSRVKNEKVEKQRKAGMIHIMSETDLQFIQVNPLENPPKDYVCIVDHPEDSSSKVGCVGGMQITKLDPHRQNQGTVIHELLHVAGLKHPFMREDATIYLNFQWDRMTKKEKHNYEVSGMQFGPYPFDSIMNYPIEGCSKIRLKKEHSGLKKIWKTRETRRMGQSDKWAINVLYAAEYKKRTLRDLLLL